MNKLIVSTLAAILAFAGPALVLAQSVPTAQATQSWDPTALLTPILGGILALAGGVIGALATWALTRPMERAKNAEAFRTALIQKRVDTALRVQIELHELVLGFTDQIAEVTNEVELRKIYQTTRRKLISLLGETGFTNPLIYGYVNGVLRSNVFHAVEEADPALDLHMTQILYRRTLNFMTIAYSLLLFHSTEAVWRQEPTAEQLLTIEQIAESDVAGWLAVDREMKRFTFTFERGHHKEMLGDLGRMH